MYPVPLVLKKPLAFPSLGCPWNAPALGGGGSLRTVEPGPTVQRPEERLPLLMWNGFWGTALSEDQPCHPHANTLAFWFRNFWKAATDSQEIVISCINKLPSLSSPPSTPVNSQTRPSWSPATPVLTWDTAAEVNVKFCYLMYILILTLL